MSAFETIEHISQPAFLNAAEVLLAKANDPSLDFESVHEAASDVNTRLSQIASGDLVVEPPLTQEQIDNMQARTHTIINLSRKSIESLEAVSGVKPKASRFRGSGKDPKS